MVERFHFDADGESLTALVYSAVKPIGATLLLAHGLSGGQESRFMVEYATGLAARGVLVVTFEFPFMEHGRRTPDRNEVLETSYRAAVVAARECRPKNRLFIGGKSLGGRVAAEVANEGGDEVDDVAGIVVLGYPLHPMGKPDAARARHLADLPVPALVVQGTRDVFGTAEELQRVVRGLPKGSELHVVEGGDHSFTVPKRGALSQNEVHASIQDEIARWIAQMASAPKVTARARPRPIAARVGAQLRSLRRTPGAPIPERRERARAKKSRAEKLGTVHESKRAGAKASYAREAPSKDGRVSRKSTRKSANRAKPDTNLVLRQERASGSPETRYRRARARATRVRGSPAA